MLFLFAPLPARAALRTFYLTLPCYDAGPVHPDTLCGFQANSDTLIGSNPRSTPIREAWLWVWRFDTNDTLKLVVPAAGMQCQPIAVTVELEDGIHYEASIAAVDMAGNVACIGSRLVGVTPALETTPGLFTELYDAPDFTAFVTSRTDPKIDFDWDYAAPAPGMGVDQFSIRWLGYLTPAVSGSYQFHARKEDGCRLKVGSTIVIDAWGVQEESEVSGTVILEGGQRYELVLDFMAWNGDAMMRLSWTPPGGPRTVIPAEAFSQ